MIPFQTTPEQIMTLATIMVKMEKAGLDQNFIVEASELARSDQGVYDLTALWLNVATNASEQDEIIAAIQESLDDYRDAPQTTQTAAVHQITTT